MFRLTYLITIMFLMVIPVVSSAQNTSSGDESDTQDVDLKTLKRFYDDAKELQKQGKYTEARVLFLKVKEMAKSAGAYSEMIDYRIAQCYEGEGDFENAIKHYKIYLGAKQIPPKGPAKAEVRAKIEKLQQEMAASSLPHDTSENTGAADNQSGGVIEEDVMSPDQVASSSARAGSASTRGHTPAEGPGAGRTRGGTPYPPQNNGTPTEEVSWWGQYGPYVVIGLAATLVLVGGIAASSSMNHHSGNGSVTPDSIQPPADGSTGQGGVTILSW